jgi:two-component system sensor histidine kinase KdpD
VPKATYPEHSFIFNAAPLSVAGQIQEAWPFESLKKHTGQIRMLGHYVLGLTPILLITLLCRGGGSFKITTVGFTYILTILIASNFLEFPVLLLMSFSAALAYDYYFIPPVDTFNVDDSRDWIALFSFLITAVIGSHLATKARMRAEEADRKRRELKRLYDFSQRLLLIGDASEISKSIPTLIADCFQMGTVAMYICDEDRVFYSSDEIPELDMECFRDFVAGSLSFDLDERITFVHLRLGARVRGALGFAGTTPSKETLEAMTTLTAIAIDRHYAMQKVAAIEASRERERFKSVLLDAITHDFRTPLTSIKVSATGLLEDEEFGREQRKELLTIIDEECDRISMLVGQACELARLESGELLLEKAEHSLGAFISAALADCRGLPESRPIALKIQEPESALLIDPALAKKVLIHLVMNAHLYSTPKLPITISAEKRGEFHFISVTDEGPGIERRELAQIFEKFYRGRNHRMRIHGTGMGLPIAKAIVEAHGGTLEASSRPGLGSTFTFSLPITHITLTHTA